MALPIIIFGILLIIALALFLFGASRENLNSGFSFIMLSAVMLIITGLFIWTGGIELNQVASMDTTTDIIQVTYTTMQATNGSPIWVLSNLLVFGGIGLTLLSLGLTVRTRRIARQEANAY